MNIITQLLLVGMAIVFVPAIIIVIIQYLVDGEITCDDDDDTSATASEGCSYTNKDIYGRADSFSYMSDGGAASYSLNGDYTVSTKSGRDMYHYGTNGYRGRSYTSESGEITHYDKDNVPSGYSRPNGRGGYDHCDRWNLPTGSSNKDE